MHIHIYIRTYIHTHSNIHMHTYINAYIHACMHACIHIHTHSHTHIHTHTLVILHSSISLSSTTYRNRTVFSDTILQILYTALSIIDQRCYYPIYIHTYIHTYMYMHTYTNGWCRILHFTDAANTSLCHQEFCL